MNICAFGDYDPTYNRTAVILRGLVSAGTQVSECRTGERGVRKYLELWKLHRRIKPYDILLIPSSDDRLLVLFAKLLTRRPVVFDMLYAMYDNWIEERELAGKRSVKALYYRSVDWVACRCARLILVENNEHGNYFANVFRVPKQKFIRVFVGADDTLMRPLSRPENESFLIEFHGKFFPMQGTDTIIRAAALLRGEPHIRFLLIGGGQEYARTRALAERLDVLHMVEFLPWVPYAELPEYIAKADITLGLLGNYPRTVRSMPNKLFESAAMGRVCITADAPSVRELFTDGVDVALVQPGDPQALAEKILWLRANREVRDRIEMGARATFLNHATPQKIGYALRQSLEGLSETHALKI